MNAPANLRPMARSTFTVWRLSSDVKHAVAHSLTVATLPQIEREIAVTASHGATVFVLEQDAITGAQLLHAYRIRRGKWAGRYDADTGTKTYPCSADKLFALPVAAFEPVEPWRWSPGCDVVGVHIDDLIEGRAA
jgi:hypothetical protein